MRLIGLPAVLVSAILLGGCSSSPAEGPASTYLLGEKVQVGKLSYTAFETQWLTHLGDGAAQRVPENRFFLIRISTVNSGNEDVTVPNPTIVDDKGKSYEEVSNGEGVPQWAGYLRMIHPADSVQGNIVFDAPPAHYKLKVWDDTHTRFEYIDVPLSFGSETPEVPIPGGGRKQ